MPEDEQPAATPAPEPPKAPARAREPRESTLEKLLGAPTASLLAVILFVLVNYLSARHYRRFDWTADKLFTLSPRSREIARSLREPMEIYVLMGPKESQYSDVFELAQRYAAESGNLRVHSIDPDHQRDRFLELARRLELEVNPSAESDVSSEAAVVLVRGTQHRKIAREALAGLENEEGGAEAGAQARVTVERAISEAILLLDRNESTKVCFSSGHGEFPLQGGDDSVSLLVGELKRENVVAEAVTVTGTAAIPAQCDALVVAGPRQAFTESEAEVLQRFLRAGGNVLLMVDPFFVDRRFAPSGLEPVARLGGVELTPSIVIEGDTGRQIANQLPVVFQTQEFGEHTIVRALRGTGARILVETARALRRAPGSDVVPEGLVRASSHSWGETSTADALEDGVPTKDSHDIDTPIHLAMAAQLPDVRPRHRERPDDAAGRMVVFGWSHLATNEELSVAAQARFANGYLVISAVGWLTARRELLEIPARTISAGALSLTAEGTRRVQLYAIVLVPLAAALVGFAVWRSRKAS